MTILEVIFIGLALSMDALAITVANCTTYHGKLTKLNEWSMPILFSLFQFLMPVIGFFIGAIFSNYLTKIAGYITFVVFLALTIKIVFDNLNEKPSESKNSFSTLTVLVQAVATSIDALIIGVTLSIHYASPFVPALIIGCVTFLIISIGLFGGKYLGKLLGKYTGWAGAVILGALAIKNLIEAILG